MVLGINDNMKCINAFISIV